MGHYVSNIFGIRGGGVFSGPIDMEDFKKRVAEIVRNMRKEGLDPDLGDKDGNVDHCMSSELEAHKGSYIVIAGVFNYWFYEKSSEFAKRLSKEFGTEVMHMCWNEDSPTKDVNWNIWLNGEMLFEITEGGATGELSRIIRRML